MILWAPMLNVAGLFSAVAMYGIATSFQSDYCKTDIGFLKNPILQCSLFTVCYGVSVGVFVALAMYCFPGEADATAGEKNTAW